MGAELCSDVAARVDMSVAREMAGVAGRHDPHVLGVFDVAVGRVRHRGVKVVGYLALLGGPPRCPLLFLGRPLRATMRDIRFHRWRIKTHNL